MPTVADRTFTVSNVRMASVPLPVVSYREAIEMAFATSDIESCPSLLHVKLVPCRRHGLMQCVGAAFNDHRPLSLSPDHIWLLVCQGLAMHLDANAEALRHRLVTFEGKQRITIRRDDFVKGTMENPWEEALPEFVSRLRMHLGTIADLFAPKFSTTGIVETAACHVTLLDAVQSYFDYRFSTRCGIPQITLEGTPQDWQTLRQRANGLEQFDCGWWTMHLLPVLDQFAAAASGQIDQRWWQSFFKQNDNSGGPYITGHIVNFFPYVLDLDYVLDLGYDPQQPQQSNVERNPCLGMPPPVTKGDMEQNDSGLSTNELPSGLSKAPFVWDYLGDALDMEFISGFIGIRQDMSTMTLRPEIGWAVRHRSVTP